MTQLLFGTNFGTLEQLAACKWVMFVVHTFKFLPFFSYFECFLINILMNMLIRSYSVTVFGTDLKLRQVTLLSSDNVKLSDFLIYQY